MREQRSTTASPHTLYEEVAAQLTAMIEAGTFQVGDRLPSVRQLCRQMQVSVSTVMEAYRLLEDQGRVEVRPQSGHYVCAYSHYLAGRADTLAACLHSQPCQSEPTHATGCCAMPKTLLWFLSAQPSPMARSCLWRNCIALT